MKTLDNCVGLRILGRDGRWKNVEVPQLRLEVVTHKFRALVVNNAVGTRVTRQPTFLKLERNMRQCFTINSNDLAEIHGCVNDCESVELYLVAHVVGFPGTNKIHGDFTPGHEEDVLWR